MTAEVFSDDDADLSVIQGRAVAVIGYGSQGQAQALSLRDSGVDVRVGLPMDSRSRRLAEEQGLRVLLPVEAAAEADLVMLLVPDATQRDVYASAVAPSLRSGSALLFGDGFAIRYGLVVPPSDVDVAMVSPIEPGELVRRQFVDGKGVPVLVAVAQDFSGDALPLALSYAKAIGGTRAGAIRTTFTEAAEARLFGEQAVAGGVTALAQVGFELLTDAGYAPEVAYIECLHELKRVVDLMYSNGVAGMRSAVSGMAEYGDVSRGPRVIDARVRDEMRQILTEIRSGSFSREWVAEDDAGRPQLAKWRQDLAAHPLDEAGQRMRAMMSWVDRPTTEPT